MIYLYSYIVGYVLTLFGLLTHLQYNVLVTRASLNKYDRYAAQSRLYREDITMSALYCATWPIVLLYAGSLLAAAKLKKRHDKILKRNQERKNLAEEHKKILKENGISF